MDANLRKSIAELGSVAEEFKSVQSDVEKMKGYVPADLQEKLARIESAVSAADKAKAAADTVLQEKQAEAKRVSELEAKSVELEKALEEMAIKGARSGSDGVSAEVAEHQKAFGAYLAKGRTDLLNDLDSRGTKAVSTVADAEGGFVVPEMIDLSIIKSARDFNPMRQVSGQKTVANGNAKMVASVGDAASGWVSEKAARPETNTPTFAQLSVNMGEVYANPGTTQIAIEDMAVNVEDWLAEEVAIQFAEQENLAFTSGDGVDKPKGFLAYATSAVTDKAGTRPFETLQERVSSAAGVIEPDDLIDLIHDLRGGYRQNARFMMSGLTLAAVRKMKDADNNYLWVPGLEEGQASGLLGYAVAENDDMPEIADGTGAKAIAFGDFTRGYVVVDRLGTSVIRDEITNKPYVMFYTRKRVGGLLRDSLAIKLLSIQ